MATTTRFTRIATWTGINAPPSRPRRRTQRPGDSPRPLPLEAGGLSIWQPDRASGCQVFSL